MLRSKKHTRNFLSYTPHDIVFEWGNASAEVTADGPERGMTENPAKGVCWAVTDGRPGMENQALGLAEALAALQPLHIEVKRVQLAGVRRWFPYGALALLGGRFTPQSGLEPPWPDLLIGCGRAGAAAALMVKRASGGRTFTVQLQDPRIAPERFDLVIPPRHDELKGGNVVPVLGAPHRVTKAVLDAGAEEFAPVLASLPRPLAAVLIGGSSRSHKLTLSDAKRLCAELEGLAAQGCGLAVTTSRRTGARQTALIAERLKAAGAWVWTGEPDGPNPYFGLLALADAILVTEDSTNMVTEAAATGKPVHILTLSGGSPKFRRFHEAMRTHGATRPFEGKLENWSYVPLTETVRAARIVQERLGARTFPLDKA